MVQSEVTVDSVVNMPARELTLFRIDEKPTEAGIDDETTEAGTGEETTETGTDEATTEAEIDESITEAVDNEIDNDIVFDVSDIEFTSEEDIVVDFSELGIEEEILEEPVIEVVPVPSVSHFTYAMVCQSLFGKCFDSALK